MRNFLVITVVLIAIQVPLGLILAVFINSKGRLNSFFRTVYFLMGLQSIPQELYECADIDGANGIQKFTKITIPMLAPILQIVLMLAIVDGMKINLSNLSKILKFVFLTVST